MSDTDIARAVLVRNLNQSAFAKVQDLCRHLAKRNRAPRFVDDTLLGELETAKVTTTIMAEQAEELFRVARAAHRLGLPIE